MRIRMHLSHVQPDEYAMPTVCGYDGCEGKHFKLHQRQCRRSIADTDHDRVNVQRYRCLSCKRTFRVYPRGVSGAQRSDRLKAMGIMLYGLGLSYGAVEDALHALGLASSKVSIYREEMTNHRRSLLIFFAFTVLFFAPSCSRISPEATATPAPTIQRGDSEHQLTVDELSRTFLLHIPPGLNRQEPVPVLFVFHGRSMTAASMKDGTPFDQIADQSAFVVVYPQGVGNRWNIRTAGEGRANESIRPEVDEAAFIDAMVSELNSIVEIDPRRVYAMGFSQGGALVYQLACDMSDIFAAVASLAGPMERIPCEPSQPVSVIHGHGLADMTVPFEGGGPLDLPPAEEGLATWRRLNQCTGSPKLEEFAETVTHTSYSGCENGTAVEVYTIEGLGHRQPSEFSFGATVWDFFAAHPKP